MEVFNRELAMEASAGDENRLTFSFASEAPYLKESKTKGKYNEVLLCNDEAIDFTRLVDNRCPLLLNHDTERQIGVVEKAYTLDGKLYCDVKFSDGGFAQQIMNDVKAGIRRNTSIGYSITEAQWTEGNPPTLVATRWLPLECSIVPIPADPLVGYQRSLETEKEETEMTVTEEKKEAEDVVETKAAESKACEDESKAEEKECTEEQKECTEQEETKECDEDKTEENAESEKATDAEEIRSLGEIVGKKELAEDFISMKKSLNEFKEEIKKLNNNPIDKEIKKMEKFSLRKALLNAVGKISNEEATFERNIIAENKKRFNINDADIVVTAAQLRAFDGTEALNQTVYQPGLYAGVLRAPVTKDFIGTRKVAVTGPSVSFAVATSGVNAGYVDINGDVPSATMDFSLKSLTPKKAGAYVDVSYQSLLQDDPSAEQVILEDISKALAQVQDAAFFNGTSGNNQPVGLLNTDGVNTVTVPDTPSLSTALEFEKKIRESNNYSPDLKWVFGTDAYYKWASTPYSAAEQNKMLIDDESRKCIGYDCFVDHNIPASTVILGDFGEALEADFDGISIKLVTEDKTLARKQAIEIIAYAANDYCFRRPKSFTKNA